MSVTCSKEYDAEALWIVHGFHVTHYELAELSAVHKIKEPPISSEESGMR